MFEGHVHRLKLTETKLREGLSLPMPVAITDVSKRNRFPTLVVSSDVIHGNGPFQTASRGGGILASATPRNVSAMALPEMSHFGEEQLGQWFRPHIK